MTSEEEKEERYGAEMEEGGKAPARVSLRRKRKFRLRKGVRRMTCRTQAKERRNKRGKKEVTISTKLIWKDVR